MAKIELYRDLLVWEQGMDLAASVYQFHADCLAKEKGPRGGCRRPKSREETPSQMAKYLSIRAISLGQMNHYG